MSQALNLAGIARRTLLSGRLTGTATEIVINGLEADTLYDCSCLIVGAADGGFGWQSRFTSGGAWDTGGTDYANQIVYGAGTTAASTAGSSNYGPIATKDAALPQLAPLGRFTLYTGSASRRALINANSGYVTTDGVNAVVAGLFSQRVVNGAIADIRFISTAANGLASGSRVFLQKLG